MVALGDFEDDPGTAFLIFFTPLPRPSRVNEKEQKMKEIKSTAKATVDKQFTTQATITTPDGKPVVSLNDLKAALPVTRRVKKPKYSDLWKEKPVLTKLMPDGGIWVYANGFMIYRDASSRPYVLRVSEIKSQTYEFADKTETCSLDALPWETALFIFGDEHRERNLLEWNGRTQVQYDGFDDCDDDGEAEGIVLTASDDVENEAVERVSGDVQRMLGETIRQIDTRREQVLVEAIIVEISDAAANWRAEHAVFLLSR